MPPPSPTIDPFSTLKKEIPIVLLPVRLETRFEKRIISISSPDDWRREIEEKHFLLVRVFPDKIHVKTHEDELTAEEYNAAHKFWIEYFLSGKNEQSERTQATWNQLCDIFGQPRTEWITRQRKESSLYILDNDSNAHAILNDTNISEEEKIEQLQSLLLEGITPTTKSWSRAPYTDVLPDYWIAIARGYDGTEYSPLPEMVNPIPPSLSLGPSPFSENNEEAPLPDENNNCPQGWQISQDGTRCVRGDDYLDVDEGMQWMVDFNKAKEVGMAFEIEITDKEADPKNGGIQQLLVFGVKSTSPYSEDSAGKLEKLFASHRYTDGCEFMLTGTPTNNTPEDEQKCKPIVTYDPPKRILFEKGIPIKLSFIESSDFRTLAFNALPGEPDNNPIIEANVGDRILFDVVNDGVSSHAFGVTADTEGCGGVFPGSEVASPTNPLQPGESGSAEFVPTKEGTYYYISTIPGHRENGLVGEIHVGAASSSGKVETNEESMLKYLGLKPDSDVFYNLNHFDSTEHTDPRYMNTILWPSSFEYILKRMLIKEEPYNDFINKLRSHFINYVNGRGILPTIRCGNTPYGILPVTDIEGLKFSAENNNDDDSFDSNLKDAIHSYLFGHWKDAAYDLPFVGKSNYYAGKSAKYLDILSILSRNPHSVRYFARPVYGIGHALSLARLISASDSTSEHSQEDISNTIISTMTNLHNSAVNDSPLPQNLLNNLQTSVFSLHAFELGGLVRPENTSDESWKNNINKNYLNTLFDKRNIGYLRKGFLDPVENSKLPALSLILRNSALLAYYYSAASLPIYFEDVNWEYGLGWESGQIYCCGHNSSDELVLFKAWSIFSVTPSTYSLKKIELDESYKIEGCPYYHGRDIVGRNKDGDLIVITWRFPDFMNMTKINVQKDTNLSEDYSFKIFSNPKIIRTGSSSVQVYSFKGHIFGKNKDGILIRFYKKRRWPDVDWETPEKYDGLLPIINEPETTTWHQNDRWSYTEVFATNSAGQLVHIHLEMDDWEDKVITKSTQSISSDGANVIVSNLLVEHAPYGYRNTFSPSVVGRNNSGDLIEYTKDSDGNWDSKNISEYTIEHEKIEGNIVGTTVEIFSKNLNGDLILYKNESGIWSCKNITLTEDLVPNDYKLAGDLVWSPTRRTWVVVGRHKTSRHVIVFIREDDVWKAVDLTKNASNPQDFLISDTPLVINSDTVVVLYRNLKGEIVRHYRQHPNQSWISQNVTKDFTLEIFSRELFYNQLEPEVVDMSSDDPKKSPWRLFSDRWPPTTESLTIGEWLQNQINDDVNPYNDEVRNLQEFWNSVNKLKEMKIPHLENLFRESLDLCSHRLDAWLTSFVVKSLDNLRKDNPSRGVHIGAYGWLENIKANPKTRLSHDKIPEGESGPIYINENNAGYVFTPSLPQATAAALLLDGHRRKNRESPSKPDSFAVNLSSDRIRRAISILQGIIEGQSVGALLGFLLERELQDKDLQRFIAPLREISPLYVKKEEAEPEKVGESVESIAPRNVADGLTLVRRHLHPDMPGSPLPWGDFGLPPKDEDNPDYMKLKSILDMLVDSLDALKDILMSESVYQGVHDIQAQTATFDAISRGEPPPQEITVTKTPLSGIDIINRIVTLFKKSYNVDPDTNWPTTSSSTQISERAKAEPRINAWLSEMLGDPANTVCQVTYLKWEPDINPTQPSTVEVSLADLGLSPIDIVYLIENIDSPQRSEIERRILDYVMKPQDTAEGEVGIRPDNVLPNSYVKINYQYESSEKTRSFADIFEIAKTIRRVLDSSRPLKDTDLLSLDQSEREQNLDVTDLYERFEEAIKKFIEIYNSLQLFTNDEFYGSENNPHLPPSRYSDDQLKQIRQNLKRASQFGLQDTFPISLFGNSDNEQTLVHQQAKSVKEEMNKRLKKIFGKDKNFDIDPYDSTKFSQLKSTLDVDNLDKLLQYFKIIFGESFIVLPSFDVNPEFYRALQNSDNVQSDSDSIPALTYIQRMSRIRESVTNFYESLSYGEAIYNGINLEFKVAQLPIPDPNNDPTQTSDQWINLESSNALQGGRLSIVVHDPTNIIEIEIMPWNHSKLYGVGEIVYYGEILYSAIVEHVSLGGPQAISDLWQEIDNINWVSDKHYNTGEVVYFGRKFYMARTEHGGPEFGDTEYPPDRPYLWQELNPNNLDWVSDKHYNTGEVVYFCRKFYMAQTKHISLEGPQTKPDLWEEIPKPKIAGLIIDEIVETVPNKAQTAGLAFNLDVPGSQPPQSILLAVPPDPTQNWSIETIETILKQTRELSKIRMVDPEDLSSTGHFLPALYFAFNSGDPAGTISTDFLPAAKEKEEGSE